MSLPTSNDLYTMDWAYAGQPFVDVPATASINTQTMDWAYAGQPFVTNPSVQGPSNIGAWDGVDSTHLQALMSVTYTNIEAIYGVS